MDAMTQEAISTLNSYIASLIPAATLPEQEFELLLLPTRILPTGIGATVGMNDDPYGEILGRRLSAEAHISITSRKKQNSESVSSVTQAILSQDRATLRANGVFRIALNELGEPSYSGRGRNANVTRTAKFDVLYEYLKIPTSTDELISNLSIDMDMVVSEGGAKFIVNQNFTQTLFETFEIMDDDLATTAAPSDWSFNQAESRVEQKRRIRGGGLTSNSAKKAGTYLLYPVTSESPEVADFILESEVEYGRTDGNGDGIGFVFRYQDINNFYYFTMSERNNYYLLGKKVSGTFQFLDAGGLDENNGYVGNTRYILKVVIKKSEFEVYMNNNLVLSGSDKSINSSGRVGLMCHGNNSAYFYNIRVVGFL